MAQRGRFGWALAAAAAAGLIGVAWLLRPGLFTAAWGALSGGSLEELAAYVRAFGLWAPVVSVGLMVLQSLIVPLPGSLVSAANGAVFGVWWGALLSWVGALAGATVSFWLARRFARDLVLRRIDPSWMRWAGRLAGRRGFWVVLLGRLTPGLSFDLISYVAGLSQIGYGHFMLATAIGIIPGVVIFNLFGNDLVHSGDNAWRLALLVVLCLAGLLVGRWWLARANAPDGLPGDEPDGAQERRPNLE